MQKEIWRLEPLGLSEPLGSPRVLGFLDECIHHVTLEASSQILPDIWLLAFPNVIAHCSDRRVLKSVFDFLVSQNGTLSKTKIVFISRDKDFAKSARYERLHGRYGIHINFFIFKSLEREKLPDSSKRLVTAVDNFVTKNHLL